MGQMWRPALVAALAVLAGSAAAADKALKDVDQAVVRKAVAETLGKQNIQEALKPYAGQIRLAADQITYTKAKADDELPSKFEWRYEALAKLDANQQATIRTLLGDLVAEALVDIGMVLGEDDAKKVLAKFVAQPVEAKKPDPKPTPKPDPKAEAKKPEDKKETEPGPKPRVVEGPKTPPMKMPAAPAAAAPTYYDPYWDYLPAFPGGPYFAPIGYGYGYFDAMPYLSPWWLDPYRGTFSYSPYCGGKHPWPVIPPPIFIPNAGAPGYDMGFGCEPACPAPPVVYPVYGFARASRPAPAVARAPRAVPAGATAERLYADALTLFWDGDYKSARDHLAAAVKVDPRDARVWYYKSLAERQLGDAKAARESAEVGAALEVAGVTPRKTVLAALERVQGRERMEFNDLVKGPKALTPEAATEIVERLKPADPGTTVTAR